MWGLLVGGRGEKVRVLRLSKHGRPFTRATSEWWTCLNGHDSGQFFYAGKYYRWTPIFFSEDYFAAEAVIYAAATRSSQKKAQLSRGKVRRIRDARRFTGKIKTELRSQASGGNV